MLCSLNKPNPKSLYLSLLGEMCWNLFGIYGPTQTLNDLTNVYMKANKSQTKQEISPAILDHHAVLMQEVSPIV